MELSESTEHRVLLVTCPSEEVAREMADALVESRAAACVNIVPGLVSVYAWKGEICRDREALLIIKTRLERLSAVADVVQKTHPYSEPELIALPVLEGSSTYLEWISTETDSGE